MKNEKFDRLLSTIRNENVDEKVVAQAGNRVWKSMAESAPVADPDRARSAKLRRLPGAHSRLPCQGTAARAGHAL